MNNFHRHAARILCALVIVALASHAAMANRRIALVIGNAKYESVDTLTNTVNDADAVAALLTKAGFDSVDERRNIGVVEFKRAVREFMLSAAEADIAVVYYSGHGIEFGGANYMIPVDAKLANNSDVEDEGIELDRIITATQPAHRLSLIILDACRDNPFLRTAVRSRDARPPANGLATVQPTGATLIAYAAKAGSVSFDGAGPNSPFTTALVKHLTEPGLDIRIALGKVRDDVFTSTGGRQEPFVYGSIGGDAISLLGEPVAPKSETAPLAVDPNAAVARDYESAVRGGTRGGWESFLAAHRSGFFADLARDQLSRLTAAAPAESDKPGKDAGSGPEGVIAAQRRAKEPNAQTDAARLPTEPAAPLQANADVAATPQTPDQACKRDEARLAQLRVNPSAGEISQFARELACADLRPQVQRLIESLGGKPLVATQSPQAAPAPARPANAASQASEPPCKRDEARLAQLRTDPTVEQVAQFARALGCEDLRPQVQRLLESLGAEPGAANQPLSSADALPSRRIANFPVDGQKPGAGGVAAVETEAHAQVCKRDAEELARLRANPDRASALRFMRGLQCEDLHPQAARLLESLED